MPANDLALILEAARTVGEIAMRYFVEGATHWEKPDNQGLVTEADLAVDRELERILRTARPGYGWLSEETEDDRTRLQASRVFVVDPIDGTRSFANGERTWAVSIALVEDGAPMAAVVHLPARKLTYTAIRGMGARLNNEVELQTTGRSELEGAEVLAARPMMDPIHWPGGVPPIRREFRSSLAYRLALVGEGRFDGMVTFRDSWEWDIAAGVLIAAEAGATVTDGTGGPLRFNSPERQTKGVLAATQDIHAALLKHRR